MISRLRGVQRHYKEFRSVGKLARQQPSMPRHGLNLLLPREEGEDVFSIGSCRVDLKHGGEEGSLVVVSGGAHVADIDGELATFHVQHGAAAPVRGELVR